MLAAVAVVVVAVAISSGGGSARPACRPARRPSRPSSAVRQLLDGIPQNGDTLGKPNAPVTMTYYGDLECPICKDFTLSGGFPELVAKDVRSGKVKVVYRSFETATARPEPRVQDPAGGRARRRPAAEVLGLRRALLPRAGRRGHGLRDRDLPGRARPAGPGPQLLQVEDRPHRLAPDRPGRQADGPRQRSGVNSTPTLVVHRAEGPGPGDRRAVPSYRDLQTGDQQVS